MKSLLRWAGSKRKLLPQLLDTIPDKYDRYVEPFAGSACLFFEIEPKKALLGDINDELINTYMQLKQNSDLVIETLCNLEGTRDKYYQYRSISPQSLPKYERAVRFIYLNRFCFNGLYRTNQQGLFNVPFGGGKSGVLPSPDMLRTVASLLKKTTFVSGSFEKTLSRVKVGDFVYLDPPYSIQSRRVFNEYSHHVFGDDQLALLKAHLKRLNRMGIPFLVSYGFSREATELAKGFNRREVVVQRQIAGFTAKRRRSRELLITNY